MRRRFLLAAAALAGVGRGAFAASPPKIIRVGTQKGAAILMAERQQRGLESLFGPRGLEVQWFEFQFGPPMLEAMRTGSVDIGLVGDTPPIFSQAANGNLVYVAAVPSGASAILVPAASPLQTLQDLKGKRVAFARGSSAHNLTVAALEKAGLTYTDIQPTYLAPADAAAAFERGSIDAWTIWDPYFALYETRPNVRVLARSSDIAAQTSYFMATRRFAEAHPDTTEQLITEFARVAAWAKDHPAEVARLVSEGTGVPYDATLRAVERSPFRVLPMDDTYAQIQQRTADRLHGLGLIPQAIRVRDDIWRAGT
jgi:NitT/TauT family transport system substrate-binding protein/sulfonate transport system substrate-binding protein